MTIEEKIERSKSKERIDFTKFLSAGVRDGLVKLESTDRLVIEPNWLLEDDWEGKRYANYISEHPEYDGIYLRNEVSKRLYEAASLLDDRYKLIVRAGHRPIEVQKRILIECAEDYKIEHSSVSDAEALDHARTFVSDPEITLPPHVCAAAVDVDVIDASSGNLLDFGTKMNEDNEKSFLHYPDLTDGQKNNRMLLLTAMLSAGFASCMPEWWHFSYGDQVWAWFYGELQSLYSPIDV